MMLPENALACSPLFPRVEPSAGRIGQKSYITFVERSDHPPKTKRWNVVHIEREILLGVISWHGAWWKYVFHPEGSTFFDADCIKEIASFIDNEMKLKRKNT